MKTPDLPISAAARFSRAEKALHVAAVHAPSLIELGCGITQTEGLARAAGWRFQPIHGGLQLARARVGTAYAAPPSKATDEPTAYRDG